MIFAGILWGIFLTHNLEQTSWFQCKYDKIPAACEQFQKEEESN